jgi:hypothetical protein
MTPETISEAIKELRSVIAVLLATALLALVTTDSVRNALLQRERAKDLAAWLSLRDMFSDPTIRLDQVPDTGWSNGFWEEVPVQSGTEERQFRPFVVRLPWAGETIQPVSVAQLAPKLPVFRIRAQDTFFPLADYAVASVDNKWWVIPLRDAESARSLRQLSNAIKRDKLATPSGWAATRVHLNANGWAGQNAEDLQLNDAVVARFIKDGFTVSYSIFGIPISPGYFAAAVSLFLGFQAFLLLGPWFSLRDKTIVIPPTSWVMLVSAAGFAGFWLRLSRAVVSIIVVLLPLVVLLMQLCLVRYMTARELLAWKLAMFGPIAAAAILAALAAQFAFRRPIP